LKFNFGEEDFKFPPKDGYIGLCKAPDGSVVKSQHSGRLDFQTSLSSVFRLCYRASSDCFITVVFKVLQ